MAGYDAAYRAGVFVPNGEDSAGYNDAAGPYNSHHFPAEEGSEFSVEDALDRHADSPTMLVKLSDQLADVSTKVLESGKQLYLHQRHCIEMGEGPTLLRFLCFLGGLGMLVSSILSMINLFALFTGPSTYVLQIYQGFFGIITMVVEAKDWDCLDQFKPWLTEWFRFLTVPAGKGAFYVFVGSLGVSLWVRNLLAFTIGLYMSAMGLICVAVHAGASRKSHAPFSDDVDAEIREAYNIRGLMPHDPMTAVLNQTFHPANGIMMSGAGRRNNYHPQRLEEESDGYFQSRRETTTTTSGMGLRPSDKLTA